MAVQSILTSVKKILGIPESDTSFDVDVMLHINSVFAVLTQIGIGPDEGFMIEDSTATWDAFVEPGPKFSSVKSYMTLRVRVLFDPPNTSFAIEAMERQIRELEWRLNVLREGEKWMDPSLSL